MRIYKFTYKERETDWVFAPTMKEAKEFYLSFTQCGDLDNTKVTIVPKKDWGSAYLLDPDDFCPDEDDEEYDEEIHGDDNYSCGMKILMTFKEYAENNNQTDMIATTEF